MKPAKLAGARTPPKIEGPDDLVRILNKTIGKRAELQPPFIPPKGGFLSKEAKKLYHIDLSLTVDTKRSFASLRSTIRYLLIEVTSAIKQSRESELVGWEAQFVRDIDKQTNEPVDGYILLLIRGWFKHL